MLAWADFTGDGREEMLVNYTAHYLRASGRSYSNRLLTRHEPDGPLIEVRLPPGNW